MPHASPIWSMSLCSFLQFPVNLSLIGPPYSYSWFIYLLTAIGLTPGGSSTVHIYTQIVNRTTQLHRIHWILHT
jgi:hypothetical protein